MHKLTAPAFFLLLPQLHRARRHLRIRLVRSISGADHAGLAPRRSSGVPRNPVVEQRDLRPATQEVQGSPSPKRARSNHCDMRLVFHLVSTDPSGSVEHSSLSFGDAHNAGYNANMPKPPRYSTEHAKAGLESTFP